jgi:pyruvate, orthophosphate dikinase
MTAYLAPRDEPTSTSMQPEPPDSPLQRVAGSGCPAPAPLSTTPAVPGTVLPPAMYLIGCGTTTQTTTTATGSFQPSAQTMGFKAWNLLRMSQLSLPVPPAFVLGTHYCIGPAARALTSAPILWASSLQALEVATGLKFGDARRPLLLSVRSGAPVSMPGMMETLLNIGLCDATVSGLLRLTGNPRLVWDAYRRLVASYGEVVAGVQAQLFDEAAATLAGDRDERELDFADLRELTRRFLGIYEQAAGQAFPQDPQQQLAGAIEAVFASWVSDKARAYRQLNGVADAIGTAVTVQSMVFGNAGGKSGAGVGFTRDPSSGEPALWVDFLFNAQGEDVVSGRRSAHGHDELATVLPAVWLELQDAARQLEQAFRDMQDFEFTVQDARLFLLQTRSGKRTPQAAARIALDLLDDKLIDSDTARLRVAGLTREALGRPRVVAVDGVPLVPLARAATASSGVAIGEIALDAARAASRHEAGVAIVLVRRNAETGDIAALEQSAGLLTQRGARTSHAAVVARQLGKVCLVGCADLHIDEAARSIQIGETTLREGDLLTLDGNEGNVYAGAVRTEIEYPEELLARLASFNASHEGCA